MNKTDVGIMILKILVIVGIIGIAVFNVWACANYGNKPINEVPAWILWLMLKR